MRVSSTPCCQLTGGRWLVSLDPDLLALTLSMWCVMTPSKSCTHTSMTSRLHLWGKKKNGIAAIWCVEKLLNDLLSVNCVCKYLHADQKSALVRFLFILAWSIVNQKWLSCAAWPESCCYVCCHRKMPSPTRCAAASLRSSPPKVLCILSHYGDGKYASLPLSLQQSGAQPAKCLRFSRASLLHTRDSLVVILMWYTCVKLNHFNVLRVKKCNWPFYIVQSGSLSSSHLSLLLSPHLWLKMKKLCDCLNICFLLFVTPVAAVLKPLVEVLSDPDSINRMLLSQLEKREQQLEQQKKAYTYAASYEDFIKLISTSVDVNFLKQLR